MSVISDLISKVNDPDLRARLSAEVARMQTKDCLTEIAEKLSIFNRERDWEQFHDAKNLALSISIEASELNECFLWKNADEADRAKVEEELADVFLCAIMLADKYDIDIKDICLKKIEKNAQKYPVEKAKGKATKYDEL
jgi:NTP pyrophosphatase (non-canonical NTP hydrolase)